MQNHERFNELFEKAQSSTENGGKFSSMLDSETNQLLDQFVIWLRKSDPMGTKTDATSSSYRTYVAKALALPNEKLTSDQKSGIKAFQRFVASLPKTPAKP